MASVVLYPMPIDQLRHSDLKHEAAREADNPTLEAYTVVIEGQSQRAEVLFVGNRGIAGVAWGAAILWQTGLDSAEESCQTAFGERWPTERPQTPQE